MTDPQPDWRAAALCRGNHLFVRPTEATRHELAVMTATCAACPSFVPCRDDMHQRGDFVGVRAGVVWTDPGGGQPGAPRKDLLTCGDGYSTGARANTRAVAYGGQNGGEPGVREHPGSWPTTPSSRSRQQ